MTTMTSQESATADREIVQRRVLNAPRDLVFDAWTTPQHVAQWFGPTGFRTTVHAMDFRPGGAWRFIMHGPDGVDYGNRIVYHEIARPERLVYEHGEDVDDDPGRFHVTVTFVEQDGKTELTMRSILPTAEQRDLKVKYGAIELGQQTLEKLEQYVLSGATRPAQPEPQREAEITRTFNAPRDLVFNAWTDPQHVAQWWGPATFTNPVCEVDARPGGKILIHMQAPDGSVFPMTGTFHEVDAPRRLVFTSKAVEDAEGEPFIEAMNTVDFDEQDGKTTVRLHVVVVKAKPEAAWALSGMGTGWNQSFDKLDDLLAAA